MTFLSLPLELRVHIYQNLDIRSQVVLECTHKNSFIPPLEHKCMKRIVRDRLFDTSWEQETNLDIKQKVVNYKSRLQKLVREVILSEDTSGTPDAETKALFSQIESLREDFAANVLEEKEMWDLFGGRDKFLQLPEIKLPKRLQAFYDQGQLKINAWDMKDNAIMRGTDHEGCEFFLLRARQNSLTCKFPSDFLRVQVIRFDIQKKQWEPVIVSDQVLFVKDSDQLSSEIQRCYLKELIQEGKYFYTPQELPDGMVLLRMELFYSLSYL